MFIKQPQQAISLQRRSTKFKHQTRPQNLPLSTCTPQSRIQCHTSRAPWPINISNPNIFTHILQFHSTPIGRPTQPNPTPPSIPEPEHQSTHLYSDKYHDRFVLVQARKIPMTPPIPLVGGGEVLPWEERVV